jgi:flagellin-specific chaperone FliS
VYDKITGTQRCHHHDVCDKEFLEWESMRVAYLETNVKHRIPKSAKPYYENFASLMEQCLLRCRTPGEVAQVSKKKTLASLEKWLLAGGRTREGCDLSCNIHTGVKLCPVTLVVEDLHLRSVDTTGLTELQQRTTLELLLREEEEYLKLLIYLRDNRFRNLLNDTEHRSLLHKTILDMLHCPMRTNEKVLTLLYEEIMNGAHKAQTKEPLDKLTEVIRSVGDLSESWGHKFEDNNTKVLKKFKLPLDQSKKIFAVHQLSRLREAVNIAVPASEPTKRTEWMSFLYHYVHVNEKLHSTLEYGAEDVDDLEEHIDKMYTLLIRSIGGKERGITNYFHYLGAGHLIWMVRRFGNLWRFCNEGAESLNSVASKRYNMHNNKGGYKCTSGYKADEEDKTANKCEPFEVLGSWLSRLSMWHLGMAHTMFAEISTKDIIWCPVTSTYTGSTEYEYDDDNDLDWTPSCEDDSGSASEEDDDCTGTAEGYESDDLTWCLNARTLDTWDHTTVLHGKRSNRRKFQQRPVVL